MFKMAEKNNGIYPNSIPILSNDQQLRLKIINEIRCYFFAEIKERINEQKN